MYSVRFKEARKLSELEMDLHLAKMQFLMPHKGPLSPHVLFNEAKLTKVM